MVQIGQPIHNRIRSDIYQGRNRTGGHDRRVGFAVLAGDLIPIGADTNLIHIHITNLHTRAAANVQPHSGQTADMTHALSGCQLPVAVRFFCHHFTVPVTGYLVGSGGQFTGVKVVFCHYDVVIAGAVLEINNSGSDVVCAVINSQRLVCAGDLPDKGLLCPAVKNLHSRPFPGTVELIVLHPGEIDLSARESLIECACGSHVPAIRISVHHNLFAGRNIVTGVTVIN